MADSFSFKILGCQTWDVHDDNVDVQIQLNDGSEYWATFFTLQNLETLFAKNKITGECASGLYLWASNMILVKTLDLETIRSTIHALLTDCEFESACTRIK